MALSWTQTDAISRKIHVPELCQLIRIPYMTEFGLQVNIKFQDIMNRMYKNGTIVITLTLEPRNVEMD